MSGSNSQRRLAGTASITIDGVAYAIVGQPKWRVAKRTRETMTGMTGVDGFSEKPVAGYISAQLRDFGTQSVADFENMDDVTVVLQLNSGKTVAGEAMWCIEAQEVDSAEATFEVRFEGDDVQERTA